jgi:rRNA processing protein Krr1/Pno1
MPTHYTHARFRIAVNFPEDMSNVLTVQDHEVKNCIKLEQKVRVFLTSEPGQLKVQVFLRSKQFQLYPLKAACHI